MKDGDQPPLMEICIAGTLPFNEDNNFSRSVEGGNGERLQTKRVRHCHFGLRKYSGLAVTNVSSFVGEDKALP
jgi:hypothetical protein